MNQMITAFRRKMCLDPRLRVLGGVFGVTQELGSGAYGRVVRACYPLRTVYEYQQKKRVLFFFHRLQKRFLPVCFEDAIVVAVKIQPMVVVGDERYVGKSIHAQLQSGSTFWVEYAVLRMASLLVKKKICPFFIPYVNVAFCAEQQQSFLFMSQADSNLSKYFQQTRGVITEACLLSIMMQVVVALYTLFSKCGVVHGDLHFSNIFYYRVPVELCRGWCFRWQGTDFMIPNCGLLCVIGDFGLASIKDIVMNPEVDSNQVFQRRHGDMFLFAEKMVGRFPDSAVVRELSDVASNIFDRRGTVTVADCENFMRHWMTDKSTRIPKGQRDYYHLDKTVDFQ